MNLLFLSHRIPYPPNKGDKIRSFNILRRLSRSHTISLGAFVDDERDWQYAEKMNEYCGDVCLRSLNPGLATFKSLRGFLTGEALTLPYYRDAGLRTWIEKQLGKVDAVFVFSSSMAQYVLHVRDKPVVVDFVDLDSQKWLDYSARKRWPQSWVYRREGRLLSAFEGKSAEVVSQVLLVSSNEAALLLKNHPQLHRKVASIPNGVDAEFFDPACQLENPYAGLERVIVFTGLMDYWPNIDAVNWFVHDIFPAIRAKCEDVQFYIVGAKPSRQVEKLGEHVGVKVVGAVPDIRPYVRHAGLAVAPLRIGRGIQNKVLEALSLSRQVVATSVAMDGIDSMGIVAGVVADEAAGFADACVRILAMEEKTAAENRAFVRNNFDWDKSLNRLMALFEA